MKTTAICIHPENTKLKQGVEYTVTDYSGKKQEIKIADNWYSMRRFIIKNIDSIKLEKSCARNVELINKLSKSRLDCERINEKYIKASKDLKIALDKLEAMDRKTSRGYRLFEVLFWSIISGIIAGTLVVHRVEMLNYFGI